MKIIAEYMEYAIVRVVDVPPNVYRSDSFSDAIPLNELISILIRAYEDAERVGALNLNRQLKKSSNTHALCAVKTARLLSALGLPGRN